MTALLQEAFQKASDLPEDIQELVAKELLGEIEWETRWDDTLTNSTAARQANSQGDAGVQRRENGRKGIR